MPVPRNSVPPTPASKNTSTMRCPRRFRCASEKSQTLCSGPAQRLRKHPTNQAESGQPNRGQRQQQHHRFSPRQSVTPLPTLRSTAADDWPAKASYPFACCDSSQSPGFRWGVGLDDRGRERVLREMELSQGARIGGRSVREIAIHGVRLNCFAKIVETVFERRPHRTPEYAVVAAPKTSSRNQKLETSAIAASEKTAN